LVRAGERSTGPIQEVEKTRRGAVGQGQALGPGGGRAGERPSDGKTLRRKNDGALQPAVVGGGCVGGNRGVKTSPSKKKVEGAGSAQEKKKKGK